MKKMKKMHNTPIQAVPKCGTMMGKKTMSAKTGMAMSTVRRAEAGGKMARK